MISCDLIYGLHGQKLTTSNWTIKSWNPKLQATNECDVCRTKESDLNFKPQRQKCNLENEGLKSNRLFLSDWAWRSCAAVLHVRSPCEVEPSVVTQEDLEHDDHCAICKEDGELQPCHNCPRAFHPNCLHPPLKTPPRGPWYCPKCQKKVTQPATSLFHIQLRCTSSIKLPHNNKTCVSHKQRSRTNKQPTLNKRCV